MKRTGIKVSLWILAICLLFIPPLIWPDPNYPIFVDQEHEVFNTLGTLLMMVMIGLSGVDIYRWAKKQEDNRKIVLLITAISVICTGGFYFFHNRAEYKYPKYSDEEWKRAITYEFGTEIIEIAKERGIVDLLEEINLNQKNLRDKAEKDVAQSRQRAKDLGLSEELALSVDERIRHETGLEQKLIEAINIFLAGKSYLSSRYRYAHIYPLLYEWVSKHKEITPKEFERALLDALNIIPKMEPPKISYKEMRGQQDERTRVQRNITDFSVIAWMFLSILSPILIKWGAIKEITKQANLHSNCRKAFVILWKNALAIIMLIVAMNDIDEAGYYTLLRIVIFLLSLAGAFRWFKLTRPVLCFLFIGLAILFNPIVQIHFDRDIWFVINSIAIALFTIEGYFRLKAK